MSVESKVKEIVIEQLGVSREEIKTTSSFVEDLGADSLDLTELIMAMEEEFDIEIEDEDAQSIATVQDAVKYIEAHMYAGAKGCSSPACRRRTPLFVTRCRGNGLCRCCRISYMRCSRTTGSPRKEGHAFQASFSFPSALSDSTRPKQRRVHPYDATLRNDSPSTTVS
jgi:acyl carrier protein